MARRKTRRMSKKKDRKGRSRGTRGAIEKKGPKRDMTSSNVYGVPRLRDTGVSIKKAKNFVAINAHRPPTSTVMTVFKNGRIIRPTLDS